MKSFVTRLIREEDGSSSSGYAIHVAFTAVLVAFIAVAVVTAVKQFDIGGVFMSLGGKVSNLLASAK